MEVSAGSAATARSSTGLEKKQSEREEHGISSEAYPAHLPLIVGPERASGAMRTGAH